MAEGGKDRFHGIYFAKHVAFLVLVHALELGDSCLGYGSSFCLLAQVDGVSLYFGSVQHCDVLVICVASRCGPA
ncbi:MAG TPA: hypothetical protein DCR55_08840 [Lentisphaeria bacterium]|nr:hypothetical protein [Lentisphaeria bacterium]